MKTYTMSYCFYASTKINAQQPLDTIYAKNTKKLCSVFPRTIRQGITGSE